MLIITVGGTLFGVAPLEAISNMRVLTAAWDAGSARKAHAASSEGQSRPVAVTAPIGGVVSALSIEVGALVNKGEVLARVLAGGPIWIDVSVPPDDAAPPGESVLQLDDRLLDDERRAAPTNRREPNQHESFGLTVRLRIGMTQSAQRTLLSRVESAHHPRRM